MIEFQEFSRLIVLPFLVSIYVNALKWPKEIF